MLLPIGVGNGFRRPRPPNRACGFPAHGSPVGGFLIGIGTLHMNCDDGEQPLCREQDISYWSPVTPLSGASNMRSFHSEASAHDRFGPFASAPCLTLTGTAALGLAPGVVLTPSTFLSPFPQSGFASHSFSEYPRNGTMKILTPARLTHRAGLPTYFATPSCRSVSNHGGCLAIAYHHASVSSEFRTSP